MRSFLKMVPGVLLAVILVVITAPNRASAQQIYEVNELTEKPRIASPMAAQQAIQNAYPRTLQARGVDGKVILQFVILSDGHVDPESVVVQSTGSDELGEAAKTAIQRIQFIPGMVSGSAVATRVVFPITFVAG